MSKSPKKTSCVKIYKPLTFQLGYFLNGTMLFLLVSSKCSLACSSETGFHWHGPDALNRNELISSKEIPEKQNVTGVKNHYDRNSKIAWGGWTPSPEVKQDWQEWLTEWEKKYNHSDAEPSQSVIEERKVDGFPTDWLDLGEGLGGVAAPPWSYSPKNIGKPEVCHQPPKRGNCTQKLNRWGYNGYTEKCVLFVYTGCRGNSNNFLTQLECEKRCLPVPTTGCEMDLKIDPW